MPLPKYNGPLTHTARDSRLAHGQVWHIVVALLLTMAREATAQRATGPWEDGSIAPQGVLRLGVNPRFEHWKERQARVTGTREPLGTDFTRDSLGPSFFPFIAGLSPALTTLTGLPAPPLSLGTLQTILDVTQVTTHITLDYGITSRIGLQALVPYVKNRVHVSAITNEGGVGATLGFNPARSFQGARQQNELVVTTLGTAASSLASELARCQGSADPACTAINADRAGAAALVQQASDVSAAVAAVYGTPTVAGGLYAPVAGAALHNAVDAQLSNINARFRTFLGTPTSGEWVAARPVPAAPMAAADFSTLLSDPAHGVSAHPLGDYEHSHLGDIEVGAKFLLLDTFGSPGATAPLPRAGALRLAAAGIYRLPTGQLDLPYDFTDIGTGDRQADLELRGYVDVALGSRFWMSGIARFAIQRPDRLVRRITDRPGDPFPELAREQEVGRDLGDVLELEISPRYVPNNEFAISALYRYRTKGADTWTGTFQTSSADGTPLSLDAGTLGIDTEQSEQLFGFAVTYSTVRGYSRRAARWPLEISYMHTQVRGGEGVGMQQMNGIALRFYRPVRGNVLRAAGSGQGADGSLAGGFEQLPRVRAAHLARGVAAQHPRHLRDAIVALDDADVGRRHAALRALGHHDVVMGARRDLRQVRDREHLVVLATRRIVSPTLSPTVPPMPASTSSKTSVGTRSSRARIVLSASITRDNSPPDATRASGRASCPTFSATRNSTSSAPADSSHGSRSTQERPSGMPRSGSTSSTSAASLREAFLRSAVSRGAAPRARCAPTPRAW